MIKKKAKNALKLMLDRYNSRGDTIDIIISIMLAFLALSWAYLVCAVVFLVYVVAW